ncbi:MAG: hypothetical protein JNK58_13820 [Phycisphaerae bacterium]|nr:hypothetical protein [Phycisphaerae bacterium]
MSSLTRSFLCPIVLASAALSPAFVARAAWHAEAITSPASAPGRASVSPGVVGAAFGTGSVRSMAALSLSAPNPDMLAATDAAGSGEVPTNFRGEPVAAAPVRFHEDFESGQIGPEWRSFGGRGHRDGLTHFADPSASGGMVLNVKTEADSPYEVRLDVYLIPPTGGAVDESSDNTLTIFVDDQPIQQWSPQSLREVSGERAEPGKPTIRTIHVPFTASERIAEIRFEASPRASEGWPSWGIDNLVIDRGLQDPVFGISGGAGGYDSGFFGSPGMGSDMNGEIPSLPKSRYGSNEPFAGSGGGGGGGGGGSSYTPENPTDQDRNDDGIDDEIEDEVEDRPERVIPSVPTMLLVIASAATLVQRRR